MTMKRNYSELITIPTFKERYEYLRLDGKIGIETFGFDRYLNQALYNSYEWRRVRDEVIIRDQACDLAMPGYEIPRRVIIHHMNPITIEQINDRDPIIFDPEYLITTCHSTHNAIHYGDESLLMDEPVIRRRGDTSPWKKAF